MNGRYIMPNQPTVISIYDTAPLSFEKNTMVAGLIDPSGEAVARYVEIRTNPVSGRTSRVTFSRSGQPEPGTDALPEPPPDARDTSNCPFCRPQVMARTPRFLPELVPSGRLVEGDSILFPNLFPYTSYSAVSLIDNNHFVEIGTASLTSYTNSFKDFLKFGVCCRRSPRCSR